MTPPELTRRFGLFALLTLLLRLADAASALSGSALSGADDEVWISVMNEEKGHLDADTYKTYRFPITESFTVIGLHAIPVPGIHHMKLKLRLGKGGGDREFFGYDGISTVCPPPPLRLAVLTDAGDVGETLGPGDEWVLEIHNREPMEGGTMGFKVLTMAKPLPNERALTMGTAGVGGFTLPPGQERITADGRDAAGGYADDFVVPRAGCSLLAVHGHFHRRGVEQAFFLNGEELGRITAEQMREPPGGCPAPPVYLNDTAIVMLGGRDVGQGDVVSTACTYDTSGDAEAVRDGERAEDEMCSAFLMYACGTEVPATEVPSESLERQPHNEGHGEVAVGGRVERVRRAARVGFG